MLHYLAHHFFTHVGKIQRKRQSYGFIELTQPEVSQFKSSNILNNTCRIICDAQQDVFIVLMSLHLSQDDYLQIKLKKINGEINDNRFHSLHFSKRSVLVSMVTNTSRVIYDQQSSFSLGYVCISKSTLCMSWCICLL